MSTRTQRRNVSRTATCQQPASDVSTKPWRTVETLCPPMMSIVSSGFEGKDFGSVETELQRMLGNVHPGGGLTSADLVGEVKKIVGKGGADYVDVGRTCVLYVVPILGPTGLVHGAHLWLGPRKAAPPKSHRACGLVFEFDTLMVHKPLEFTRMLGCPDDMYHERRPLSEMLDGTLTFEGEGDLIRLLHTDRTPGGRMRFAATVPNYQGYLMKWQITLATPLTPADGVMVLVEDLTSDHATMLRPSLADVGLKAHSAARSRHVGIHVVTADHDPVVPRWLTAPPSWIHHVDPFAVNDHADGPDRVRGFFHPDNRSAVVEAGADDTVVVRCLDHNGGHSPTRVSFTPYPDYDGLNIRIIEFQPAATPSAGSARRCPRRRPPSARPSTSPPNATTPANWNSWPKPQPKKP
jgi:hypothetical protein